MIGRRLVAGVGAGLFAVSALASCGTPTSAEEVLPARFVEQTAVSEKARQVYGEGAADAYRELANWSLAEWLRDPLLTPGTTPDRGAFETGIVDRLAPSAEQYWLAQVDKALAGDRAAQTDLQVLRFHMWGGHGLTIPGDSAIGSQAISSGKVGLAPEDAQVEGVEEGTRPLMVSFTQTARLDLRSGRDPYPATLSRSVSLMVVPADSLENDPAQQPGQSPTPSRSPTGGTGGTPVIGTQPADTTEINPDANWVVTGYQGRVDVDFDKALPGDAETAEQ